ncbi:MAG: uL15 family ribosomal protein, partial [Candidatus Binatia bacterium]
VESLRERGIVKKDLPVKVLAGGQISKKLTVTAHRVSAAARSKIEAAGGTVNELTPRVEKTPSRKRDEKKSDGDENGSSTESPE